MPDKKVIDFKNLISIKMENKDSVINEYNSYIKIIYSEENDIQIKFGQKNEWLSKDEIFITGYKKEFGIDSPFLSSYKILFVKLNGKYTDRILQKRFIIRGKQKIILKEIIDEFSRYSLSLNSEISPLMIKSMFELFFLGILRDNLRIERVRKSSKSNDAIINTVIDYLKENIDKELRFLEIVKIVGLSSTGLKNLFKEYTGMGVMKYFNYLKIEKSKTMLCDGEFNVTQISNALGYDSIHYFSRQFKNFTGVSPTQYIREMTSQP
ncbi:MAG: helix-turn-helix transcriptional regulator [Ruminococcaceae bacterium]|nr:helix-turn-helix transcriptional regulator [Oscillospiraceae bacterium]